MAVQTIKIVAGNSAPSWLLTAKRAGVVIDLTGVTSVLLILAKGNTIQNTGHQPTVVQVPATSGIVRYNPQVTDCPTPGKYKADLKVTYADGSVEILYDQLIISARKALGT